MNIAKSLLFSILMVTIFSSTANTDEVVYLEEDFNIEIPATWEVINNGTQDTWEWYDYLPNTINETPQAAINLGEYGIGYAGELITPLIDCSGATVLFLEYWHVFRHNPDPNEYGTVDVWDGTEWVNLFFYQETHGAWHGQLNGPEFVKVDISQYINPGLKVRFLYDDAGDNGWCWAVDDVKIYEPDPFMDLGSDFVGPVVTQLDTTIYPTAKLFNYGSLVPDEFTVTISISNSLLEEVYFSERTIDDIYFEPTTHLFIEMEDVWIPAETGEYLMETTVIVENDENPENNSFAINNNIISNLAYGYNVYTDGNTPQGPIAFSLDDPTVVYPIANQEDLNFTMCGAWFNDTWYGITSETNRFFKFNNITGEREYIAYLDMDLNAAAMAFDYTSNTMYVSAVDWNYFSLYTLNLETAEVILIGENTNFEAVMPALACDISGRLYTLGFDGNFYSVNKNDVSIELIGYLGVTEIFYTQDMAFDYNTGILYWGQVSDYDGALYTINTATGHATKIDDFPGTMQVTALCVPFKPADFTVTFNVVDLQSEPVEGATVTITSAGSDYETVQNTNEYGEAILFVDPGEYNWVVTAENYLEQSGTFGIIDEDKTVDVTLSPVTFIDEFDADIQIFPNPADEFLIIETNVKGNFNLHSIKGEIILTGKVSVNSNLINVENVLPGVYFLQIEVAGGVFTEKIVIQ